MLLTRLHRVDDECQSLLTRSWGPDYAAAASLPPVPEPARMRFVWGSSCVDG